MKKILITLSIGCIASTAFAQSAMDGFRFSQPDMRGTARSLGMGGAFGALGNDLSSISTNPAGLGFYRQSELGMTMDWDIGSASAASFGNKQTTNNFKYSFDNIGGVATIRFFDSALKNFNIGFSYNKAVSFDRKYRGGIGQLQNSVSNYIAGIANNSGLTVADVEKTSNYDPYNPPSGGFAPDWLTILGYDSYAINPEGDPNSPSWKGQFGTGTTGSGAFDVNEKGGIYEYNIAFAANIYDVLYVGMNFDIVSLDYKQSSEWREGLNNAYIFNPKSNSIEQGASNLMLSNYYKATGTGFNYQLGLVLKPMQELRFGLSFHTPTYFTVNETYGANMDASYFGERLTAYTNNGQPGNYSYNLNTPWKVTASAATVLANSLIWSNDFEWNFYKGMKFAEANSYDDDFYGDYGWDSWSYANSMAKSNTDDYFGPVNTDVSNYYKTAFTWRTGLEYWVNPYLAVRAGYSYVGSPVEDSAADNHQLIYTSGTNPAYVFDKGTNYVTCGAGLNIDGFYCNLAYVYKNTGATYHAYTPDPQVPDIKSPQSSLSFNNHRIVLSAGIKF